MEAIIAMKRILALILSFNLLLVAGCASMSQEECKTGDWYSVGYNDGKQGRSTQNVERHQKACSKHGVTLDMETYLNGWDDGVLRYCTRDGGFNAGSRGSNYAGVCPADLESEFLNAYNDGRHLYDLRSKVDEIESDISSREERIRRIDEKLETFHRNLYSSGKTEKDRDKIRKRIRELKKEKRELRDKIVEFTYQLGRADARYEDYRAHVELRYLY
jgi:hypothetical protein